MDPVRAPAIPAGFAEPAAEAFDADPLRRRETVELVSAYYRIDDPALRRRLFELARALAVGAERPEANLGVIYDPREWTWQDSGTWKWLSTANAALPMCYWELYADQGIWADPSGCVSQAHADLSWLAPGRQLEYIPMLEGDTSGDKFLAAMDAARSAGSSRVSIWRRGVVRPEVWEAAWNIWEPTQAVASAWPSYWVWSPCPWVMRARGTGRSGSI